MKLHTALLCLLLAACATPSSQGTGSAAEASLEGGGGPGGRAAEAREPVRVETPAGSFLVSPAHEEDFKKVLAGEPTPVPFFAGADVP